MNDETERRVLAAVAAREGALVDFLAALVNADSPTEDKALAERVGDMLAAKAASLGMRCTRDSQPAYADNRICRLEGTGGAGPDGGRRRPRVLMVGHFDTVYAAGTAAARPFRIEGNRAFGPGVLDMKGGLALGLFAIEAVQTALGALPCDLTFIFNSDEETGSPRSRDVIVDEAGRHDLALVLEPGRPGPALTVGRCGVAIFRLEIEGIEAHAGAEPDKGANAIVEAALKTLAIQALADRAAGTIVTPGVIAGGTKPYVVPGRCSLAIDVRVPTLAEQRRVEAGMAAIAAATSLRGTRARLSGGFHRPPMECGPAAQAAIGLMQRVAARMGFPLGTATTGGASDGNLTAAAGTPTIDGLGPHGGRAHSPEEFIELPSLAAKCRVLACFLAALADGLPREEAGAPAPGGPQGDQR